MERERELILLKRNTPKYTNFGSDNCTLLLQYYSL